MGFLFWRKKEKKKNIEDKNEKQTAAETEKKDTVPQPKAEEKENIVEETAARKKLKKVYHISLRKSDGKWQVKYSGGKKAIKLFDTQAEAIKFAEERAESQDGRIAIHKKDGKIRKTNYSKKTDK